MQDTTGQGKEEIKEILYGDLTDEQIKAHEEALKVIEDDYKNSKRKFPWFMSNKSTMDVEVVGKKLLERSAKDNTKFITFDDTKEIYYYQGGIYIPGGEDRIREWVQKVLGSYSTVHRQKEVVNWITYETLIKRDSVNPKWEICLDNGIYDIEMQEFTPHTSNVIFTSKFNIRYDPHQRCIGIQKFLNEILPQEEVESALELMAYILIPNHKIQKFFLLSGEGNNGKGVYIEIIQHMIPKEFLTAFSMKQFSANNSYAIEDFFGKIANICGDDRSGKIRDSDFLKSATSGTDYVTGRAAFGRGWVKYINSAKLIFNVNDIPDFEDLSHGMMRRPYIIEFLRKLTDNEVDVNLVQKLTKPYEISGLFNVLLEKIKVLQRNGRFTYQPDVMKTRRLLESKGVDSLEHFLNESCVGGGYVSKDFFYQKYCEFTEKLQRTPHTKTKIGQLMKNTHRHKDGRKPNIYDDKNLTVWVNVRPWDKIIRCENSLKEPHLHAII